MGEYLLSLIKRREELERAVFTHPPEDWADFQRRVGRYNELTYLINDIQGVIQEKDT